MPRRKKEDEELLSDKDRVPRGAANARERTRMRVLSKAFGRLKLTLPWVPPDTKLSKLDTLRLATSYITHMKTVLEDEGADDEDEDGKRENQEATVVRLHCWPYGHNRTLSSFSPEKSAKPLLTTFGGGGGGKKSINGQQQQLEEQIGFQQHHCSSSNSQEEQFCCDRDEVFYVFERDSSQAYVDEMDVAAKVDGIYEAQMTCIPTQEYS